MKALVFDEELLYINDYPMPEREGGEALIRVLYAGICNTDVEIVKGYMKFKGILGHEFVGVVEECDEKSWLGKRVVGEINCECGTCHLCQSGLRRYCPHRTVLGIVDRNGAFAEYLTLPIVNLHEVPDSITNEEAVFVEPLAAAYRIVEQVPITPSDRVIVLGDGKLGLLVAQVMHVFQCDLTVIGKHTSKLLILGKRGLKTFRIGQYNGEKADYVIDCTGSPEGFEHALQLVHPQGMLVLKSTYSEKWNLDVAPIVIDEITIVGSRCGPFEPAIRALFERSIEVKPLITETMSLKKGKEAFNVASKKGTLKVLFKIAHSIPC